MASYHRRARLRPPHTLNTYTTPSGRRRMEGGGKLLEQRGVGSCEPAWPFSLPVNQLSSLEKARTTRASWAHPHRTAAPPGSRSRAPHTQHARHVGHPSGAERIAAGPACEGGPQLWPLVANLGGGHLSLCARCPYRMFRPSSPRSTGNLADGGWGPLSHPRKAWSFGWGGGVMMRARKLSIHPT